jgi:hypothetical protein
MQAVLLVPGNVKRPAYGSIYASIQLVIIFVSGTLTSFEAQA